jgi:hypothetical protein
MRARHLSLGILLATTVSCGSDTNFGTRSPPEVGIVVPVDATDPGEGGSSVCPDNEPKIGDHCPPGFSEGDSCMFEVGQCTGPNGVMYPDYVRYCCITGSWINCGGMSVCDSFPDGSPPDARAPVDGAAPDAPARDSGTADAPDAGVDAGGADAEPEAGQVDAGPDTPAAD